MDENEIMKKGELGVVRHVVVGLDDRSLSELGATLTIEMRRGRTALRLPMDVFTEALKVWTCEDTIRLPGRTCTVLYEDGIVRFVRALP